MPRTPNTAEDVVGIVCQSARPQEDAAFFALMSGAATEAVDGGVRLTLALGDVVDILTPAALRQRFGAVVPDGIDAAAGLCVGLTIRVGFVGRVPRVVRCGAREDRRCVDRAGRGGVRRFSLVSSGTDDGREIRLLGRAAGDLDATPLHRWLGFRVEGFDTAMGTLVISAPSGGPAARFDGAGQAHGGAIATLIDSCAAFACSRVLGRPVPTMNMLVDFLRPAAGAAMTARRACAGRGKAASLVDVDVMSGGKLVATGRCVLASAA